MNFDFQSEARETILHHASQRLIAIEADLKRAESCFALKRQALAQLGDECMLLRHAFLEGSIANLYFRRALDVGTPMIDPMNDTMTIPVAANRAGPVPLRTYHSSTSSHLDVRHSLIGLPRDSISRSIPPCQPTRVLWHSAIKIRQHPWYLQARF